MRETRTRYAGLVRPRSRVRYKNMFGSSAPPPPALAPPPVMPDPLNPANLAAQQKAMAAAATGGRSSTILTTLANRTPASTIAGGSGAYTAGKLSG
jgi:hypothetical protein